LKQQVSPAVFAAAIVIVVAIVAIVGYKMTLGKAQPADTHSQKDKAAYMATSGGAGSAGHINGPGGASGGGR